MTTDTPDSAAAAGVDSAAAAAEASAAAEGMIAAENTVASPREALLEADVARYRDQAMRALAESENIRRRLEQAAEDRGRYAVSSFAKDMLQVADNLRRALDSAPSHLLQGDPVARSLFEGVELTEKSLLSALERHGIRRIDAKGQRFDANFHQAMMEVPNSGEAPGTVVNEIQAGYTIHDRLLRPALVGVAKAGPGEGGVNTSA